MSAQLDNASAHRNSVSPIARLQITQADTDTRLGSLITYGIKPFRQRLATITLLIA